MTSPKEIPIQFLKGVGPSRAKLFVQLGVRSVEDLLYLFPRRYEDRRKMSPVNTLKPGEEYTVEGSVLAKGGRRTFFNKKHVFEMEMGDDHGRIHCVWFNQSYLDKYFHVGDKVVLHGRVDLFKGRLQLVAPEYEVISRDDEHLSMGRIVPVYPLTKGMGQRYLRKLIAFALEHHAAALIDVLPPEVRARQGLGDIAASIASIHFPENESAQEKAAARISFEEFFFFQICVVLRRLSLTSKPGFAHTRVPSVMDRFGEIFPFALTSAQKKVIAEIAVDMAGKRPMLRLLQGDVGCGKTAAALFGCVVAWINGKQAAIMAPTEILAEQHFKTILRYVAKSLFGKIRVALLNSALKKKDRAELYAAIKAGEVDIIVGTHALIEDGVRFKALSYAVIDEQHKFGVKQRALLAAKGKRPDLLVMTATPIPRTLSLTLYGDLDVSTIDAKPGGRGKVQTYHVVGDQADGVYKRVAEWVVERKTQAYIVYPIIEESETLDIKAAADMYAHFQENEFKGLRVGLVHGRLPREAARRVMDEFQRHEIDILVTTTVLEVGIDVPNANVMVVEHAERFGLAQLHQLRGRIGRSEKNAVCILLGDPVTADGNKRIEALVKTSDGFKLAELDLEIRGPGQYFGRHQHGLNELKVINPLGQRQVLEAARAEAAAVLKEDPALAAHPLVLDTIHQRYPAYLEGISGG
ncbi:MAG: ATP-dependent DNA helicase RecG [Candidatus Omnitrophota bacterium]